GDALIAVDSRGRLLAANDAAHRRLALDPRELPALREKLAALLPAGIAPPEDELFFEWPSAAEPHRRVICTTVNHGGRVVGAVLRVPPRASVVAGAAVLAAANASMTSGSSESAAPGAAGQRSARPAAPSRTAPTSRYAFEDILGQSEPLQMAVTHARVCARNDLPVVIHGESGTGKELFAHGIHGESARGGGPFVAVNCGAIPSALIEAELFGYESGTFTGGSRDGKKGRLEDAHGGTLFLDEVSELSPQAQTALLRALQESEVVRLGGNSPRAVDVRVVVATNKELAGEVAAGRFRQDLFFRLHVLSIEIPPLRARPGDVEVLARAFLVEAEERIGRSGLELSEGAIAALEAHSWPGNVRELKNAVLRAAAIAKTSRVEAADLRLVDVRPPVEIVRPNGDHWAAAPRSAGAAPEPQRAFAEPDPERDELLAVLDGCGWNIARTAATLGVSRMTLYRRLRKYDISR
ncbi:MAG TPA: sigma 54-interacting transcriptional regulator, partial [Anaeromyxobacteraceae bacterium]|nr:sigma 54-interacting transcriptional regulator [Anaeromyxobacteraceae bacterium]